MTHRKSIFSLFGALLAILFVGCAENVEQLAKSYLDRAEQSFAHEQYSLAKLQLDSIKELYPTAFEARAKAQTMMLHIDLTESQRAQHYLDSLLTLSHDMAQPLIPQFYLDKDPAYQEIGHYYDSRYRTERNVGRTYLRPQTDEKGAFMLVVFYRGKDLKAHTLRFTAPDGTYTEVTAPHSHTWNDASGRAERLDFAPNAESSVASFVEMHADKTIKVELIGDKGKAAISFAKADKQSLTAVANLAMHLRNITDLEGKLQDTQRRIDFVQSRLQADSLKRSASAVQ